MLVALMTRIPEPGLTKTRLMPFLTPEECALLHSAFIMDMVAMLEEGQIAYQVYFDKQGDLGRLQKLLPEKTRLIVQAGSSLGEKMYNALADGFNQGYPKVAVLGTDLPALEAAIIWDAARLLDHHDVVIGPTSDGGYFFIAMHEPIKDIFEIQTWGVSSVFHSTIKQIERLKMSWAALPVHDDIDYFDDLYCLWQKWYNHRGQTHSRGMKQEVRSSKIPYHTLSFLQAMDIEERWEMHARNRDTQEC
ncbi:MAG: TIGR04282 family arsenosugar biosynthesis glycosyltransferase [Bacillota bacterium]